MPRRKFTEEFKRSAVTLVIEQQVASTQAAKDLGIGKSTLENWLRQYRERAGWARSDVQKDKDLRIAELERENRKLRMERDILKKATAFFAREQP
jgi:transposase